MSPRGIAGSGTRVRNRSSTKGAGQRASSVSSNAQQIIWQGACLDGQHLFQLTRSGMLWQLYELNFTGANTASRKMVTTQPMFREAFDALETSIMSGGTMPTARLANRSIPRDATNAIPSTDVEPIVPTANAAATRRVRRRTSVNRSAPATATAAAV